MLIPGIGEEGQRRLIEAHVVVVGCGALGCGVIDQLGRAGIGSMKLIDRDVVEWSNLQRQTLFEESDARDGLPKVIAAKRRMERVNARMRADAIIADLTHENVEELLLGDRRPTMLLDGTDNLETRYLLNDVAVKHGIPLVYGGVIASRGMQMTVIPHAGPCLRCVFPEPTPAAEVETCDTSGVLGAAVGIVSSAQAAAAIGFITHATSTITPKLLEFDVFSGRYRSVDLKRLSAPESRATCIACGCRQYEFLSGERARPAVTLCGKGAFQIPAGQTSINLEKLAARVARSTKTSANEFFVKIQPRAGVEMTVFADARAVIRGVANEGEARAFYDRFVGA